MGEELNAPSAEKDLWGGVEKGRRENSLRTTAHR